MHTGNVPNIDSIFYFSLDIKTIKEYQDLRKCTHEDITYYQGSFSPPKSYKHSYKDTQVRPKPSQLSNLLLMFIPYVPSDFFFLIQENNLKNDFPVSWRTFTKDRHAYDIVLRLPCLLCRIVSLVFSYVFLLIQLIYEY